MFASLCNQFFFLFNKFSIRRGDLWPEPRATFELDSVLGYGLYTLVRLDSESGFATKLAQSENSPRIPDAKPRLPILVKIAVALTFYSSFV
jgi:hypothetical protein